MPKPRQMRKASSGMKILRFRREQRILTPRLMIMSLLRNSKMLLHKSKQVKISTWKDWVSSIMALTPTSTLLKTKRRRKQRQRLSTQVMKRQRMRRRKTLLFQTKLAETSLSRINQRKHQQRRNMSTSTQIGGRPQLNQTKRRLFMMIHQRRSKRAMSILE